MLLHILRPVRFLACSTDVAHVSELDSNLHQLLELVSTYDAQVAEWIHEKSNKYTLPDICNELLGLMALTTLRGMASCIRGRNFTIMVDETTDSI